MCVEEVRGGCERLPSAGKWLMHSQEDRQAMDLSWPVSKHARSAIASSLGAITSHGLSPSENLHPWWFIVGHKHSSCGNLLSYPTLVLSGGGSTVYLSIPLPLSLCLSLSFGLSIYLSLSTYPPIHLPTACNFDYQVIRGEDGETCCYPVVETVQLNNVCHTTLVPVPDVNKDSLEKAQKAARQAAQSLWGAGVFGVELFLMKDGSVLLNEIAPR